MLFRAGFKPTIADAADGADGIFDRRAHPDYSLSGSAFTTEDNIDAERTQDWLGPPQSAGERSRASWPSTLASPRGIAGTLYAVKK